MLVAAINSLVMTMPGGVISLLADQLTGSQVSAGIAQAAITAGPHHDHCRIASVHPDRSMPLMELQPSLDEFAGVIPFSDDGLLTASEVWWVSRSGA